MNVVLNNHQQCLSFLLESPQSSQVKIKTDTSQSEIVGGQSEEADTPDENNVERLKKDLKAAREQIQRKNIELIILNCPHLRNV